MIVRVCPFTVTLFATLLSGASAVSQGPVEKSLAEWVTQLGSKVSGPRQEAYRVLLREKSPRVVALLGKQIESFEASSQDRACNLLRRFSIGDTRQLYKELLTAKEPFLRVVSAAQLLPVTKKNAERKRLLPVLVAALAAFPNGRKMSAVHACGQVLDEAVLAELRRWLKPKQSSRIVTGVLRDLLRRERGTSSATNAAAKSLLTSEESRVLVAAHAYLLREDAKHEKQLADLCEQDPALFWAVYDLLPEDEPFSKVIVAVHVAALMSPRSTRDVNRLTQRLKANSPSLLGAALRELIGHDKDDIRAAALKQLSTLRGGLGAKDLRELLRSEALVARLVAADTMRRRDDDSGLEVVMQAVPKAGKHRVEAARVLSQFRSRKAMPMLLNLLNDKDVQVRIAAWGGVQGTMKSLFPYRRFDFGGVGYDPRGNSRLGGIDLMRAWWVGIK